ncbi:MAG: hypothetical protein LWX09_11505 [Bacteroidia bacterium]|nr:hypothetical protein [Bacteroidia bacterium]
MRLIALVLLLLTFFMRLQAANPDSLYNTGFALHFSATPPLVSGMYIVSIENKIAGRNNGSAFVSAMVHGGYVGSNMGWSGFLLALAPDFNLGRGSRFVEFSPGIALHISEQSDRNELHPWLHLGYRRQKPGKSGVFRAGIGYPTILYLGYGVRL